MSRSSYLALLSLVWVSSLVQAQDPAELQRKLNSISWEIGPVTAKVGDLGNVKVPTGYKYTGVAGTRSLLELTQNMPTPRDLGTICPVGWPNGADWFLTFEWDAIGYVKDDDKNNLDGNAILESMKGAQERDNEMRRSKGWPQLELVGWDKAPFYDPQTNLLTWATRIREIGRNAMETVNYNSRVLGRGGVMSVNLVISPKLLDQTLPTYRTILGGYTFNQGSRYSEFRAGDKVATYGLTALVAGGAAGLAAKSGILGKLGKFIIYIVIGIGAAVSALFKKIFGRSETSA